MRNLVTLLQGVTKVNGYFADINTVEREVRGALNVTDLFPYVGIAEAVDVTIASHPGNLDYDTVQLQVVTYIDRRIAVDAGSTPSDDGNAELNAWISALLHRMWSLGAWIETLDGYAIRVNPLGYRTNQGQTYDDGNWWRGADFRVEMELQRDRTDRET